jgi:DNA-nicking Smr family endonuclease
MSDEDSLCDGTVLPIDGELDLHTFRPDEAADLIEEYMRACLEKNIYEVRIIHGKGKGALLRTVHALLRKHPAVVDFKLDTRPSGWGATIVRLKETKYSLGEGPFDSDQ